MDGAVRPWIQQETSSPRHLTQAVVGGSFVGIATQMTQMRRMNADFFGEWGRGKAIG